MNYFELFGLPVSLQVDKATLSKTYIELQKQYHPDFFSNASAEEQADVLEKSSQINKGLKVLQNQDALIKYVLQLNGMLEEEEKYELPPAFLMEMMELNEALDESNPEAITGHITAYENELYKDIEPIISGYNDATASIAQLEQLKAWYFKKKYLQRILERIAG